MKRLKRISIQAELKRVEETANQAEIIYIAHFECNPNSTQTQKALSNWEKWKLQLALLKSLEANGRKVIVLPANVLWFQVSKR